MENGVTINPFQDGHLFLLVFYGLISTKRILFYEIYVSVVLHKMKNSVFVCEDLTCTLHILFRTLFFNHKVIEKCTLRIERPKNEFL